MNWFQLAYGSEEEVQILVTLDKCQRFTLISGYASSSLSGLYTLKCLSIGTPKSINFPFVPNEKLMDFRCPNIQAHHNYAVICLNCGT